MTASNDKTQTSTQTSTMFPALESGWNKALNDARKIYQQYQGALAPLNAYSTEALNQTANIARQGVPGLANANAMAQELMGNSGLTLEMRHTANQLEPFANGQFQEDPRLQQMLDTNANRAANAASTRFGGGRYGSAAIGNGVGSAVADANNATMLQSNENARNRQLQAAGMLGNLYQGGINTAMQAAGMLPTLNNLQYDGASRLAGVGDFYQGRDQAEWDGKKQNLGWYTGILGGMGNLGGTTVSTTPKQSPSLAQGILGGAAMGAGIGSKIPGLGSGWGALGGGILGAWA